MTCGEQPFSDIWILPDISSIHTQYKIRTYGHSSGLFSGVDQIELSFWPLKMTQGSMHAPAADIRGMRVAVSQLPSL